MIQEVHHALHRLYEGLGARPNEIVRLDGARGTTLRVTSGGLWITLENDKRDIVLTAGDSYTIDRGGLTLVEAQDKSTVCVLASRQVDEPGISRTGPPGSASPDGWRRNSGRTTWAVIPRITERPQPLAKVISPPVAPTLTRSPAAYLPESNSFASGFSICCWIARFNGRAP
jgi:hypothetical protein